VAGSISDLTFLTLTRTQINYKAVQELITIVTSKELVFVVLALRIIIYSSPFVF
jgi:hypothetical protein